eukprot:EG_transcript_13950
MGLGPPAHFRRAASAPPRLSTSCRPAAARPSQRPAESAPPSLSAPLRGDACTTHDPYTPVVWAAVPDQEAGETAAERAAVQQVRWVLASCEFNFYRDSMTLERLLNLLQKFCKNEFQEWTAETLKAFARNYSDDFGVKDEPRMKQARVYLRLHEAGLQGAYQRRAAASAFILDELEDICVGPQVDDQGGQWVPLDNLAHRYHCRNSHWVHPLPRRGQLAKLIQSDPQRFAYDADAKATRLLRRSNR